MDPDRAVLLELAGPGQIAALETAVHDEQLASLSERLARLYQAPRNPVRIVAILQFCRDARRNLIVSLFDQPRGVRYCGLDAMAMSPGTWRD